MSKDLLLPQTDPTVGKRRKKYNRKVKLLIYGLCLILALIMVPAILVPAWLASKGIEINAISGIGFEQGLTIKEVSIAIQGNQMTFHQVSLAHFVEQQSAISNASWRLFSARSTIRLAPDLLRPLAKQGIELGHLTLTNTAFRFIHLSKPYLFSAHAEQIETTLTPAAGATYAKAPRDQKQGKEKAIQQRIKNVDLVLSTQPKPVLSGFIGQGALTLLLPGDQAGHGYPLALEHANFSLSWLTPQIPLTVHVRKLTPQWPTVSPDFPQLGTNLSLSMHLNQPSDTVTLSATQLHLDMPAQLPERRPQSQQQPVIHLGSLLTRLEQLPLRQLSIEDLRWGHWLRQTQLDFRSPGAQSTLPQQRPRTATADDNKRKTPYFQLSGKTIEPAPFDITLTLASDGEAGSLLRARLADNPTHLTCQARLHTSQPLPAMLRCQAEIPDSRMLNDPFQLTGLPHARLTQPIRFSLTQLQPPILTDGTLREADYQLRLSWPQQLTLHLGTFALHHPLLASMPDDPDHLARARSSAIRQLSLASPGTLQLRARYHNQHLSLTMDEMTAPITIGHPRQGQASLLLRQFGCTARPGAASSSHRQNTLLDTLQCHAKGDLRANLRQLLPQPGIMLRDLTLSSDLTMQWADQMLAVRLRQNQLAAESLQLATGTSPSHLPPAFIRAEADSLQLQNNQLSIKLAWPRALADATVAPAGATSAGEPPGLTLTTNHPVTFSADYRAEKQIGEAQAGEQMSRLPVQKYRGDIEFSFNALSLNTTGTHTTFTGDYQSKLNFQQNNQRFPPFHSHGQMQLRPETARLSGTLTNARQAPLFQYTVTSELKTDRTHVQVRRNNLEFTQHQSLREHYLPLLPLNYNLTSGNISLYADLVMEHQQLSGEFGLFTEHLQGHLQGFHFADVNASLTAEITPDGIRSKFPLSIRTEYLHVGLLLEDFIAQAEFDTGRNHYALHRASTRTLGGTVSTRGVSSHDLRNIDRIPIQIQHLDLQALMEMLAYPDIELTGILDGTLPLSVQDGLPVINSGRLHSRYPGGVLRYKSGSSIDQNIQASTSDSLKRISQILKNYKFDSLAVDVDYSKEGKLKASSRFKGANPDFQSGQPVYINLNIEDDVPALIKTMNAINSSKLEGHFLKQLGVDE